MSEERNERAVFEGDKQYARSGGDRRKAPRRKTDWFLIALKYVAVAVVAALLAKYFG